MYKQTSYKKPNIAIRLISIILSIALILTTTELYASYNKEHGLSLRKPLDFNSTVNKTKRFQTLYQKAKDVLSPKLKEDLSSFGFALALTGVITLGLYGLMNIPFPSSMQFPSLSSPENNQNRVPSLVWRNSYTEQPQVIGNSPIFSDVSPEDSTDIVNAVMKILHKKLGNSKVEFKDFKLNLGKITVKTIFENHINATRLVKNDSTNTLDNARWFGKTLYLYNYKIENGDTTYITGNKSELLIKIKDNRAYIDAEYQSISIHELVHIAWGISKNYKGQSLKEYLVNLLHDEYKIQFEDAIEIEKAIGEVISYDSEIKFLKDILPEHPYYLSRLNEISYWRSLIPNDIFNMLKYKPSELYRDFIKQGYVKGAIFSKENEKIQIKTIDWEEIRKNYSIISQDFIDWDRKNILEDPASFVLQDGKDRLSNLNKALDILRSSGFISDEIKEKLKGGIGIFEGDITRQYFSDSSPEIQIHSDLLNMNENTIALFIARSILRFTGVYDKEKKLEKIQGLINAMDIETLETAKKDFDRKKVFKENSGFYDWDFFEYILDAMDKKIRSNGTETDSNIPNLGSIKNSSTNI